MPAISAPKKPAPKLLPTQAPMAQGPARRGQKWSSRCRRREGHHQRQPGDADIKKFLQIRSVAASGTAPLPYNMTETASRIPPETTKGIICDTPVIRCWRVFLVFAPVRSLLAPERCRARDSYGWLNIRKRASHKTVEKKCIYWIFVR